MPNLKFLATPVSEIGGPKISKVGRVTRSRHPLN